MNPLWTLKWFPHLQAFLRLSIPVLSILGGCISGCIFDTKAPAEPIVLSLVGDAGDTISPMPTLRFAVSTPLADSSVDFDFTPPVAALYSAHLNATRDTITLAFTEMLEGNTTYVLRLKRTLTSTAGATLQPSMDSTVIHTAAREHEPNNSFALCDTLLLSRIFGMLSMSSDTDVYCVPAAKAYRFYLSATDTRDTFLVFDSLFTSVPAVSKSKIQDTITIPDTTRFPVYIKIFSYVSGTTGVYEFGIVQK